VGEGLGVGLIPQSLCSDLGENVISRPLIDPPEFDVVLCAPLASKNPAVGRLFEAAGRLSF
jgi:DNA-binding transcriptional LysR family regulator